MLTVGASQMAALQADQEMRFVRDLTASLSERYPHIFSAFPEAARYGIITHLLARGRRWGMSWASSLATFAELMLAVAPNFDDQPSLRSVLVTAGCNIDQVVCTIAARVAPEAWELAEAASSDLPIFVNPDRQSTSPVEQTAAALPLALSGLTTRRLDHRKLAAGAERQARQMRLDGVADAPLTLAVAEVLYGRPVGTLTEDAWVADLLQPRRPPRAVVAMLKFRIALDHGRFV